MMKATSYKQIQCKYRSLAMVGKGPLVHSNPCHDERGRFCSGGGGGSTRIDYFTVESARNYLDDPQVHIASQFNSYSSKWAKDVDGPAKEFAYRLAMENQFLHSALLVEHFNSTTIPNKMTLWRVGPPNTEQGVAASFWGNRQAAESYQKRFGIESIHKYEVETRHVVPSRTGAGELWANHYEAREISVHSLSIHSMSTTKPKKTIRGFKTLAQPRLAKRPRLLAQGLTAHQVASRIDPTRTLGIRNRWAADMGRRFFALRRLVWKAIVDEDCFGLGEAYVWYRPVVHSNPCHDEQGRFCSGGTSFYRWSNLSEFGEAIRGRRASTMDITDRSDFYFSPFNSRNKVGTGKPSETYVRVVLDRNKLVNSGWQQDPRLAGEGTWRPKGKSDNEVARDYIRAVKSIEVHDVARGWNFEDARAWIKFRFPRPVEIIDKTGPAAHELSTPTRAQFDFPTSAEKVGAFMDWLSKQQDEGILEVLTMPRVGASLGDPWTNMYVKDTYGRGVARARYDLTGSGYPVPTLEASGGLVASMSTPFHMDRLGVLYTRAFDGLKGITSAMDMQISHVLAQGLADGDNPIRLARKMSHVISGMGDDLGVKDTLGRFIPAERRARMLARTEVIRAHAQAQLQEFKNWGVAGVNVMAEWVTAGFNVCPLCLDLASKGPYTIEQAMGMIPAHPHCRCAWRPEPVENKEVKLQLEPIEIPEPIPEWVPISTKAKDMAVEAQDYLISKGMPYASFRDISVDHIPAIVNTVEKLASEYGVGLDRFSIGTQAMSNQSQWAAVRNFHMKISEEKYLKLKATGVPGLDKGVSKGQTTYWWSPEGVSSMSLSISKGASKYGFAWPEQKFYEKYIQGNMYFTVNIPNENPAAHIVEHEFGHILRRVYSKGLLSEWGQVYQSLPRTWWMSNVSEYAGANLEEGFAEAFRLWKNQGKAAVKSGSKWNIQEFPGELRNFFEKFDAAVNKR